MNPPLTDPIDSPMTVEEDVPLADDPRTPLAEEAVETNGHGNGAPIAVTPGDLGPIAAKERIAEMDILRGFALLGICVINLQSFLGPFSVTGDQPLFPAWYDRTAEFLINLFGSGKFNAMFSFLFGVGFAIQMERAAAKGGGFASMYVRRLLALLAFGAAHLLLLWEGDVLHIYALIGLPLILFRRLKDIWLWGIMVLTLVGPIAWFALTSEGTPPKTETAAYAQAMEKKEKKAHEAYDRGVERLKAFGKGEYQIPPYMPLAVRKERAKNHDETPIPATVKVVAEPSYPREVKMRAIDWVREMREGMAIFWAILGTTLIIGFIAGRRRIFQDIPGHMRLIKWTTIVGGVLGLGISLLFATTVLLARGGDGEDSMVMILGGLAYIFGRPFLCAFYMGAIILMARTDRFRSILQPLALVGRMPLTNYLMHSVVWSFVFYGYGLGLYYRVGPAVSVAMAFTLYAIQVAYSNWWMKRFRFGPAEWLWRTLTYGKAPSMSLSA